MKAQIKKLIPIISALPFIIGVIGYGMAGYELADSTYASFALYFVNPVNDDVNVLINIARWTSALVMTTAILYVVRNVWTQIMEFFLCVSGDSVAVYSDNRDLRIRFEQGAKVKALYPGREFKSRAASHIIMLDSDMDSLDYYKDRAEILQKKNVYICLRNIEYGLLKVEPNLIFYDINGSIARKLWKKIALWKENKTKLDISIYGDGSLAQNILNYALTLNLMNPEQEITYHFICDDVKYRMRHKDFKTFNKDRILYHKKDDDVWDIMAASDIIVLAEEADIEMLGTFSAICRGKKIYYYSPEAGDVGNFLAYEDVYAFGQNEEIYTDENIRRKGLITAAIRLNEEYARKYGGEADWEKLDGFTKWSNVSSADYKDVIKDLLRKNPEASNDEIGRLEHIRWARFHSLNYWTVGVPENGKAKDPKKRIHKCLVPYDELSLEDQEKDQTVVIEAREELARERQ